VGLTNGSERAGACDWVCVRGGIRRFGSARRGAGCGWDGDHFRKQVLGSRNIYLRTRGSICFVSIMPYIYK
jgi:hypothetical protein